MSTGTLRDFCARILGWNNERAVDQALRSLELSASHRAHLVLYGDGDLVPVALALHQRTLGTERPFIVCDPRRGNTPASVRAPANLESGATAFVAAAGGTLCLRRRRLPRDFAMLVPRLRAADNVQYIVCAGEDDESPFTMLPAPILVRPLSDRSGELARIVEEYAVDAIAKLVARPSHFTNDDHGWVIRHSATSLSEIEKGTLRRVALRMSANLTSAAERLGMAPVSLSRWMLRRRSRRNSS